MNPTHIHVLPLPQGQVRLLITERPNEVEIRYDYSRLPLRHRSAKVGRRVEAWGFEFIRPFVTGPRPIVSSHEGTGRRLAFWKMPDGICASMEIQVLPGQW